MYVVYDQSDSGDTKLALKFSLGLIETIAIRGTVATLGIAVLGYKTENSINTEIGRVYKCVVPKGSDKVGQFVWRKLDCVDPAQNYQKVVTEITSECVSWVNYFGELFQRGKGKSGGVFLKKCVLDDCNVIVHNEHSAGK
jgi:hypothetical protein